MTENFVEDPVLHAVGSLWRAKDGRILRVDGWTRPTFYPADDYWASCTVMNRAKGQRGKTALSLVNFGGFLTPHDEAPVS